MDYEGAIVRYYAAYRTRDRDELDRLLTPDFRFRSSFGSFDGRDAMLETIWPSVGRTWATKLRIYGDGPDFVVLYEQENGPAMERAPMSMAEHLRFAGERIAEIEVYVGRPLPEGP